MYQGLGHGRKADGLNRFNEHADMSYIYPDRNRMVIYIAFTVPTFYSQRRKGVEG